MTKITMILFSILNNYRKRHATPDICFPHIPHAECQLESPEGVNSLAMCNRVLREY